MASLLYGVEADGPDHFCGCHFDSCWRGTAGMLPPGAEGDARRSNGGAALRMIIVGAGLQIGPCRERRL